MRIHLVVGLVLLAAISSCGGSKKNSGCTPTNPTSPISDAITIAGTVTYEHVPNTSDASLDFDNASDRPAKGVTVQLIGSNCSLLSETSTNALGEYSLDAPINSDVFVRVKAEIKQNATASWDVSIRDNTANNRNYVLDGATINSGEADGTRDLHASSGWTGFSYTEARSAAPFAILDAVYEAINFLLEVDEDIQLPALQIRWSKNNLPFSGDITDGEIGTSFYESATVAIYLLGDANSGDTDEYDRSVVQHEFGHYLEDQLSRSDSIGGPHGQNSKLDMRLAFSEGFGNALSAMISGTGFYYDSIFSPFTGGLVLSLETPSSDNPGWFSEDSSGQILYDVFDDNVDGNDTIALGFAPILRTMTSDSYLNGQARVSIYSFLAALENETTTEDFSVVETLAADQGINSTDPLGVGETNDGGSDIVLPIYRSLSPGESIELCSDNQGDPPNGFDVHRYVVFSIDTEDTYEFSAEKVSGNGFRDPDFVIYREDRKLGTYESSARDIETGSLSLTPGDYFLDFYDFNNVGLDKDSAQSGRSCFTLSINTP